jgi:hypothetical protein
LSAEDKKELLGTSQGGAVALAVMSPAPAPAGVVLGTSTEDTNTTAASTTPLVPKNIFPTSSNGPIVGGGSGGSVAPDPVADTATDPAPDVDVAVDDDASTTIAISDDATTTDATTTPEVASTTPDVPPPPPPPAPLFSDNFDSYDGSGWSTLQNNPNGTYVDFGFDNGSGGNCRSGGCLTSGNSGSGGLGGGGHVDWMYKDTGAGGLSGAYSIWGKAHIGWGQANGTIGVCLNAASGCGGSPSAIMLNNILPNDNTWHQYYLAWRQGSANVEYCFMQDDTNASDCSWSATKFPLSTTFDAFMLTGFGSRADLGDSVWFDDLQAH